MSKNHFLGFNSMGDFMSSLFGFKNYVINSIPAILLGITSLITGYIYDTASAVYLLWALMMFDWVTGIYKSFKNKSFVSYRIMRMPLYFIATTLVLSLGWNMAKSNVLFTLLPGMIMGGYYSVYFISILENLGDLGYLPKSFVKILKDKFGLKALIDKFDKKDNKMDNDNFI